MSTPEGRVKVKIKKVLAAFGLCPAGKELEQSNAPGWYFMPVSNGMGVGGIPDFIGVFHSFMFAIEAKAPKKKPTERQLQRKYGIVNAGGQVFLIDGDTQELETWLRKIKQIRETRKRLILNDAFEVAVADAMEAVAETRVLLLTPENTEYKKKMRFGDGS
jgi:hypothetical protein